MSEVSLHRRYADALFDLAGPTRLIPWLDELQTVVSLFRDYRALQAVLLNRFADLAKRKKIVDELGKRLGIDREIVSFIKVLIDRKRLASLAEIGKEFESRVDRAVGRVQVMVRAAKSLDQKSIDDLKRLLEKKLKKEPKLLVKIDDRLIGGLQLAWQGCLLDGSAKGKLEILRRELFS